MTTSPPTWDQVIATKHWHACDLDTHTLAQCSQLARRDDALRNKVGDVGVCEP